MSDEKESRLKAFGRAVSRARLNMSERLNRKVTQQEIADKVGIHKVHLGRIENGASGAEYDTVRLLADALQIFGSQREEFFAAAGFAYTPTPPGMRQFRVVDGQLPLEIDTEGQAHPVRQIDPAIMEQLSTIERAMKALRGLGVLPPQEEK